LLNVSPDEPVSDAACGKRVLVADDSRLQRTILTAQLERWGYRVSEAASGEEALRMCTLDPPDIVLSDWMMPGMDGLEFCRRFRALPGDIYSYFILLTSKSDKDAVTRGLDTGADDFLTKPVNGHELRARISAGERILHMQEELRAKNRLISDKAAEIQALYDALDRDLQQARRIQESLVPRRSARFGDSQVSLLLRPCGHVGGDLVGMFAAGPDEIGLYSIDVSGHGITSALLAARVSGYLSADFPDQNIAMARVGDGFRMRAPETVARLLNDRLSVDAGVDEYFTMALAAVNLASGHVRLVQAGHPHPMLLRCDGRREFVGAGGVPIGLIPEMGYDSVDLHLDPGDRLLLYSDGFTEAVLDDGSMLEEMGLSELVDAADLGSGTEEFLDDLHWRLLQRMTPGAKPDDEISAALLEFRPVT
jgi:sigma-B regulation protein RsbU (phosphoserine phosphatase)